MPGRDPLDDRPADTALAAALRALPERAPEPDLWPALSRALELRCGRRHVWRYLLPAAAAAALVVALLWPTPAMHEGVSPAAPSASTGIGPASTFPAGSSAATELAQLRQRSRTLERWIAAVTAHAPQDGRDLMAAVEVEDLIGLVDVQLGVARTDADALPLWRQRVALLEDLAAIRGNAFAFAEDGDRAEAMPATFHLVN
jgi:hypothetical protein